MSAPKTSGWGRILFFPFLFFIVAGPRCELEVVVAPQRFFVFVNKPVTKSGDFLVLFVLC